MFSSIYNRALEHVVMPVGDRLEGGSFLDWLRKYRREQWLPIDDLRRIQRERLWRMLSHASSNIPFYKGIDAEPDPFEWLKRFPIVRKSDIKNNVDLMVTRPKETLVAESGSGSSGIQGTVYMDRSAQASQRAMQMLWSEWSGYRMGDSILQTGITPDRRLVKRAKDFFLKTDYMLAFDLTPASISAILARTRINPRQYLFGYASSLYVLAEAAADLGISDINFKYAVSWGDKLFPHYRRKIREVFSCDVLDTYGCTEGAMVGAECTHGRFHLSINQCLIEIVDDHGRQVPRGEFGKVLVTRLDNFAMPLIRYYLGDLAELDPGEFSVCPCGRSLPLLRRVIGRDTDIVRTASGKSLIVHFFTGIFEHVPQIRQFKVVQKDLDGISIYYIPGTDFVPEVLDRIEKQIRGHLNENFPIEWIETSKIEPTKSGKPQIIQSFLEQDRGR
jgi:phenylacetate-CoA ligase